MKNLYYLSFLFLLTGCGPQAPTDEQLRDLCRNVDYAVADVPEEANKNKAFTEAAIKSQQEFDVQKITARQVELLFEAGGGALDKYFREWLFPILDKQARRDGMPGAEASYLRWKYFPKLGQEALPLTEAEVCKAFLQHPMMKECLTRNSSILIETVNKLIEMRGRKWVEYGVVENVKSLLDFELPEEAVMASENIFRAAFAAAGISDVEKDIFRQKVLEQYIALRNSGKVTNKRKVQKIETSCRYLQGPYATNTLINNPAPELNFLWISKGGENKLNDFKGKVIMLDFWATKCGACVDIFPNIKALANYYAGYPVEILGVTSIQGYHVDIKNQKNVRTTGNPELEFELMKTFMKDLDMNWKVVFTEQSVFNPEYGVFGMPQIVLIDAMGRVRYNEINPEEMPYLKAEKINVLLKEAGLPYPSRMMEQKDYRKRKN